MFFLYGKKQKHIPAYPLKNTELLKLHLHEKARLNISCTHEKLVNFSSVCMVL